MPVEREPEVVLESKVDERSRSDLERVRETLDALIDVKLNPMLRVLTFDRKYRIETELDGVGIVAAGKEWAKSVGLDPDKIEYPVDALDILIDAIITDPRTKGELLGIKVETHSAFVEERDPGYF